MTGRGRARARGRGGSMAPREPPKVFGNGRFPQPSAQVTKLENDMVRGDLSSAMAASSLDCVLPSRPAYGTAGRPIILWTNFFELKGVKPDTDLYRYSLAFSNDKLSKPRKKRLIELLLSMPPFSAAKIATDWNQKLVSLAKLELDEKYTVVWYPKGGDPFPPPTGSDDAGLANARRRNTYQITVEEVGTVSLAELLRDVSQPTYNYPLKLEAIDALNAVMTYGPSSQPSVTTAAGNVFYPFGNHPQAEMTELGGGLQAHRGYFTSVRTSVSRLLVNVNVTTGAFYKPGPLIDMMKEIGGGRLPTNQSEVKQVSDFFKKVKVETSHTKDHNSRNKENQGNKRKVHTIIGFSKYGKNSTNVTFPKVVDGKNTHPTVQAYFWKEYGIKLAFPQAPLVDHGNSERPIWLPAELARVVPGQLVRRLLAPLQTAALITFAARRPHPNATSINGNGLEVTKITPVVNGQNSSLSVFGIKVDPSMLTVPGRILDSPVLQYRGLKTTVPVNGTWNLDPRQLGEAPFRSTKRLGVWHTLIINSGRYDTIPGGVVGIKTDLGQFRKALITYGLGPDPVLQPCIVNIPEVHWQNPQADSTTFIRDKVHQAMRETWQTKPKFMLVLLPNQSAVIYDALKTMFDCELGVPSVCCIGSKFTNKSDQYFANVAMKFNQKLGGVNHTVDIKKMAPLDAQTIIFGIDVTHPSPGSAGSAPSIAGVVASTDAVFSQYPASIRCQEGREEMVQDLEQMIVERLSLWQQRNNQALPKRVIVYRDGVGESQYRTVVEVECASFKRAFDKLYGGAVHPKISIIMVGKRHHTRFYPTSLEDTDGRYGNPKPGTVVDRGVTGEKLFDFFLLAHQGLQGTSRPAHYVVLKDENKFGADQLQNLTHNLCYTFARATRSVSICPPAYYADILCERGRSYLHGVLKRSDETAYDEKAWLGVHKELAETMFYL